MDNKNDLYNMYQGKINEYTAAKESVEKLYSIFNTCIDVSSDSVLDNVEDLTVNGASILSCPEGSIKEIKSKLKESLEKLQAIENECTSKIDEYTILRDQNYVSDDGTTDGENTDETSTDEASTDEAI